VSRAAGSDIDIRGLLFAVSPSIAGGYSFVVELMSHDVGSGIRRAGFWRAVRNRARQ
jgi:hypothetical protein